MNMKKMVPSLVIQDSRSGIIYNVAGVMALFVVLAGLTDAVTSMGVEARDNRMIPIVEWFRMFQAGRFEAWSRLGVINIVTLFSGIPIYVAFIRVFRRERPNLAVFASIVFFTGAAAYLSSNSVFALFAISRRYAAASAAQRTVLEAAGRALLAQGADLTPGTFWGLLLTQIAGLLMAGVLRGTVFGKWTGPAGVAGYGLMAVFFILTAFFPAHYDTAMMLSAPGALILMAYQVMIARTFFRLGRSGRLNR